tara:strand:+ start:206 stop:811 length:606 start_codon:yes stop_codon:yes gene_type:complete
MSDPGSVYSDKNVRSNNGLLRTFMLRLTGALQALFGPGGAQYLDSPSGLFFGTVNQSIAVIDTAYVVTFDETQLDNYVTLTESSMMVVGISGVYGFKYTGNLESQSANAKTVKFWINRSGVDIAYSCAPHTLSGSGAFERVTLNFIIDMAAGEYVKIYWASDNTDVVLNATAASSPYPAIAPSACSVVYVSALPTTRPTPL